MITDIHDDEDEVRLKRLMARLSQESWQKVVAWVGAIGDITAPSIDFLDIMAADYAAFEDKGWDAHKVGQFSVWLRDDNAYLKGEKKAFIETTTRNPKRFRNYVRTLLKPMTSRAVLLTPQNKKYFPEMPSEIPFDRTTIAIEYRFFPPVLMDKEGEAILESQSFYFTRKLTNSLLKPFLSGLEHIQQCARDYQDSVVQLHRLYFDDFYEEELTQNEKMAAWQKATTLGSLIAYNNYGLYLEERNLVEAANYYKAAADRGLSTSIRNILFWLREKTATPETDRQINRYLKMGGLFGEFSNPDNNFASGLLYEPPGLEDLFKDVTFVGPQPHCIKLKNQITVTDGILEVHFRDSKHLRCLIEQTPYLNATKVYYIHDKDVQTGKEFIASLSTLETGMFIHVMAETPLVLSGRLEVPSGTPLTLPRQSTIDQENETSIKGSYCAGDIESYKSALTLAKIIENYDASQLVAKTREAEVLFEERYRDRINHPHMYPNLNQLVPGAFLCYDSDCFVRQDDFLKSEGPIIYIAPSIKKIENL